MIVHIRLFAAAKDAIQSDSISVEIRDGGTVDDLQAKLSSAHPELASIAGHSLFAIDNEYVGGQQVLESGQTVALIPPVSGG